MPDKPLRPCREPGCPGLTRKVYCEKHSTQNSARDETDKMYKERRWCGPNGFRIWYLRMNRQCQRIVDGRQCRNLANLVHHLISPRSRPDLFVDPKNVCAVCDEHHPVNTDTPHWREGIDFVKSTYDVTIV